MHDMRRYVTDQIKWIKQMSYEDIPDEIKTRARWILLDSVGCIVNGMSGDKLPPDIYEAVLKSSSAMVSTELYEGNRFSIGHPACHTVPLLLVEAGERADLTYKDALRIFICAYELASRWGRSVRFTNDMLGHGTIMNAGAAVVEGLMTDMTEEKFVNYLMTCEVLPEVSTWQSVFEGSTIHDYYPGIAAVNAKNALYMSNNNVKSSEELIRSVYGKITGTKVIEDNLADDDDIGWYIAKNYFKVHSGCRFIHPFADVIEQMMKEGLTKEDVKEIQVSTYKKAAMISDRHVTNVLAAKFSTPVSLAIQLSEGRLYPEDIERALHNKSDIQELASKISLREDDRYNELLPDVRGGMVRVVKNDGQVIEREVLHAHGDFDDPAGYTERQLTDKFRSVTERCLSTTQQEEIIESILRGSDELTVQEIFRTYFECVR